MGSSRKALAPALVLLLAVAWLAGRLVWTSGEDPSSAAGPAPDPPPVDDPVDAAEGVPEVAETAAPDASPDQADEADEDVTDGLEALEGRIEARVVDERGRPVHRALVMCRLADCRPLDATRRFRTDEAGLLVFAAPAGSGSLIAWPPNLQPLLHDDSAAGDAQVEVRAKRTAHVTLRVQAGDAHLAGWVDDAVGRPVEGVWVTPWRIEGPVSPPQRFDAIARDGSARTGPDGRFRLEPVVRGRYELVALGEDGSTASVQVDAPAQGIALRLEAGGRLTGEVRHADGRAPEAFEIEARTVDLAHSVKRRFEGEDGAFVLEGIAAGTWLVIARAGGHRARGRVHVASGQSAHLDLVLHLPGRVRGRVVDEENDTPIVGVVLEIRDTPGLGRLWASSDEGGRFEIGEVPPGIVWLWASQAGYERASRVVEVADGETVDVEIALRRRMLEEVDRGYLGFRPVWPPDAERLEDARLVIDEVFPGTPAEAAGLMAGDVIVALDGVSLVGPAVETFWSIMESGVGEVRVLDLEDGRVLVIEARPWPRAAGAQD